MLKNLTLALLAIAIVAACSSKSGSGGGGDTSVSVARNIPVPEDAKNPIVIAVDSTATISQLTEVGEKTLTDQGIDLIEADKKKGIVESNRIDMASYQPGVAAGMDLADRMVFYVIASGKDSAGYMVIEILAYYQPDPGMAAARPSYRVLVPTSHPGYQYALRLEEWMMANLQQAGIAVLGVNQ